MKRYFIGLLVVIVLGAILALRGGGNDAPRPAAQPAKLYVAMGDSVAAGVGLKDDSDSSACDRTNQAYSHQVAAALHYKLHNIACSGATLSTGVLGKQDVNDLMVSPQLQQLFAGAKPNLITLTIGANDAHWTSILAKCYSGECGSADDTAMVAADLATVKTNLQSVFARIQTRYPGSPPRVVVTGYHQVFPTTETGACTDLTGIDASELSWGRQLQAGINDTLQQAASAYAFARFVPVNFSGHELCTADPWVQGLIDTQPYHPTAAGQAAFAKAIVAAESIR